MRIAAAIPTVNRLESLKRCLDALRAQSRPLDEIIVVDNASHDGTGDWLDEQAGLVVTRERENRGCSAGFNAAMRTAYDRGHDWVFVMDDDVYPTPEALERLLQAAQTLQAQGMRIGALQTFDSKWDTGGPTWVPFSFPSTPRRAWRYLHNSREMKVEMGRGEPVAIDLYKSHVCHAMELRGRLDVGQSHFAVRPGGEIHREQVGCVRFAVIAALLPGRQDGEPLVDALRTQAAMGVELNHFVNTSAASRLRNQVGVAINSKSFDDV